MRARTNISLKTRKTLQLSDFKGVDFSSSALSVRKDRASNMRNFINEYGVNKEMVGTNSSKLSTTEKRKESTEFSSM